MSLEMAGQNLKELKYLSGFPVAERVKFLYLLAESLKKILDSRQTILLRFKSENIRVNCVEGKVSQVQITILGEPCDDDLTRAAHIRVFTKIVLKVLSNVVLASTVGEFIHKMGAHDSDKRPDINEVLTFFTKLHTDILMHEKFESFGRLEHKHEDTLEMFFYDPNYFIGREDLWRKLADDIAKHIDECTGVQAVAFFRELDRRRAKEEVSSPLRKTYDTAKSYILFSPKPGLTLTELRNKALQAYVPHTSEDKFHLCLYLAECHEQRLDEFAYYKGYSDAQALEIFRKLDTQRKKIMLENFEFKTPEGLLALFFELIENYKEYEVKLGQLIVSIMSGIHKGEVYTYTQCLGFFNAMDHSAESHLRELSAAVRLRLFLLAKPDQPVWFALTNILVESINIYSDEEAFKIFGKLDKDQKSQVYPTFNPKTAGGKLRLFLETHKHAGEIIQDMSLHPEYPKLCKKYFFDAIRGMEHDVFSGIMNGFTLKEKLMFLRELYPHNQNGKLNKVRDLTIYSAKKELNKQLEIVKKEFSVCSAERRAVRKLAFATSSSCFSFFLQDYRRQLLRDAVNGKDEKMTTVLQRVTNARAA